MSTPNLPICLKVDAVKVRQLGRLRRIQDRTDPEQLFDFGVFIGVLIIDHDDPRHADGREQ